MATTTTNYGLTKPATTEKYDIAVQNGNMDKIDAQMKANANAIAGKQATITGAATTIDTENLTASRALISDANGKVAVSPVTSTELEYLDGVTSAIQTQLNGKLSTSGTAAKATADANGKNIANTYATKDELQEIVDAQVTVDSALSSTSENPVQNKVINSALSGKQATITGGATTIATSNLTASRALVSDGNGKVAVSAVTSTELGYLDGVTSAIQTQLNGKQATITGGATTIDTENLTASRALVSDANGKVAVSAVTSTELGYLDGVTSAIQTQLNGKATTTSVETAQNTANTAKTTADNAMPKAGGTFTGQVKAQDNTSYTTAQVRNVILSTADPSGGSNGQLWFKYE